MYIPTQGKERKAYLHDQQDVSLIQESRITPLLIVGSQGFTFSVSPIMIQTLSVSQSVNLSRSTHRWVCKGLTHLKTQKSKKTKG